MMLKDKIAIITGASRGIGLETAKLFAKNGAVVIGTYNNTEIHSDTIDYYKVDITDENQVKVFFDAVVEKYGRIDVLVNNAGITADGFTKNMTSLDFEKVVLTNLKGAFNITKYVGPLMQSNHCGSIINIASIVGIYGNIGQVNYAASKSGIIGMTHTWSKEFAMKDGNVRVNAVAPGYTMTDMLSSVPDDLLEKFKNDTLLKRLAQPIDIANVIMFLASNYSSYITDEVINVNGGMKI
ncbi:MAG: SDR family oxidoreductase [bacterium]|nr:SDR family oxidoreductase [bacterium]